MDTPMQVNGSRDPFPIPFHKSMVLCTLQSLKASRVIDTGSLVGRAFKNGASLRNSGFFRSKIRVTSEQQSFALLENDRRMG